MSRSRLRTRLRAIVRAIVNIGPHPYDLGDVAVYQTSARQWRNIPYGGASWTENSTTLYQQLDIDIPSTTAPVDGYPVVIYFHPNGVSKFIANGTAVDDMRQEALAAGFVFVSVEFRHPVVNVSLGAPHNDTGYAIQYVRALSQAFNLNVNHFYGAARSRGSLCLWQSLQSDLADNVAPTWEGRQSSLLRGIWAYAAQTTYSTTEFANLFIVSGQRAAFLSSYPDDVRWGSAIQSVATAPTIPYLNVRHLNAYPTGLVNANQVDEHYSGFGSAIRDAYIAAGATSKITATPSVSDPNAFVGAVDWFSDLYAGAPPVEDNTYAGQKLLAANMGPNYDFSTRIYVNSLHSGRAWCPVTSGGGFAYENATLKADGYPVTGSSVVMVFYTDVSDADAGDYLFECTGDVSSMQNYGTGTFFVAPSYNSGTGKTTATLRVATGQDGTNIIALRFNTVPSNFGAMKFNAPGYPLNTTAVYRAEALAHFAKFKTLRFMDWLETNGSETDWAEDGNQDVEWATSRAGQYDSAFWYKHSLKACFDFAIANNSDNIWTNIPAKASDDYLTNYVADGVARLPVGKKWWIEFGNELWNGGLGQSTAYQDIRTAAFAAASVRAGTSGISSMSKAADGTVTIVLNGGAHGLSSGAQIYFSVGYSGSTPHYEGFDDPGLKTLISGTTGSTLKWTETTNLGSTWTGTVKGDSTFIFLNPTHTLCRDLTNYSQPETPHTNHVRIRYMLWRARSIYNAINAASATANVKVILGTWMSSNFDYVPCLAWAAEEYGNLSWLYSMTPAVYMEPATPNSITSTTQVFTQLDTSALDILERALRWNNLMYTWGMVPVAYEAGPHTHTADGDSTPFVLAAHTDSRMGDRVINWHSSWRNRGGKQLCWFHAGITKAPSGGNSTWPVTYGSYSDDATSPKFQAFTTLETTVADAVQENGVNHGTIRYIDVLPNGTEFLPQAGSWFLIRPEKSVPDITIHVAVDTAGDYILGIDACKDAGSNVAATIYVDGVSVASGNLPAGSVFSTPGQAFSTTVSLTKGSHLVTFHVPNASRADFVALYRCRLTSP